MSEMAAHQLLSGLVIYKSWIRNADGTRGVVGGPHRVLTETESSYQVNVRSFHVKSIQAFQVMIGSEYWFISVVCKVQEGSIKWCSSQYISIQQFHWNKNNVKFISQKAAVWGCWEHW